MESEFKDFVLGIQKQAEELGAGSEIIKVTIDPKYLPNSREVTIIVHPKGVTFDDVYPQVEQE